jgi:hypothetical protein
MGVTTYGKIVKPASENDAQKIATLNEGTDDFDAVTMGILTLSVAGSSNVTLTRVQALNKLFKFTGVLTGNITVFFPAALGCVRDPLIWNATTGAFTLTIKTTTGGSAGITITQTQTIHCYHDGTDFRAVT